MGERGPEKLAEEMMDRKRLVVGDCPLLESEDDVEKEARGV
jgi:hypothetical protein